MGILKAKVSHWTHHILANRDSLAYRVSMVNANVLEMKRLKTCFALEEGTLKAVDGVDLEIREGRTSGVIGESGCGKSVTAQSILRIVPAPGKLVSGEILFRHVDRRNGTGDGALNQFDVRRQDQVKRSG